MCFSFFAGCSLYRENSNAKKAAVAIKVGDEVVTREDVQNFYNSLYYGSNAIYRYIYTEEELTDLVVNTLVNNKIALQEAKKKVVITSEDFDEITNSIKESILGTIDERERAIFEKKGESIPERICNDDDCKDETHHHEKTADPFVEFESSKVEPSVVGEPVTNAEKKEKTAALIVEIKSNCAEFETRKTAFSEYLAELVQSEVLAGKTTNATRAFENKINELIESYEEQKYIENLEEYINSRIEITDDEVIEKYKEIIKEQKQKYTDGSFAKTYESATNDTYLYMDYSNGGYFHVQHILLQFDDADLLELKALTGFGVGLDEYRYLKGLEWLAEDGSHTKENAPAICYFPADDEDVSAFRSLDDWKSYLSIRAGYVGNISSEFKNLDGTIAKNEQGEKLKISAAELVEKVEAITNDTELSDLEKAQEFRKLRYQYGTDPGNETNDIFGYVFTTDIAKLDDSSLSAKGFVGEFVEEAYRLYGELGSSAIASSYVITDNGIHILMAYDKTKNGEICEPTKTDMENTIISLVYGQDVYDYVYALLLKEKEEKAFNEYVDSVRDGYNIEYKLTKYKEIFK